MANDEHDHSEPLSPSRVGAAAGAKATSPTSPVEESVGDKAPVHAAAEAVLKDHSKKHQGGKHHDQKHHHQKHPSHEHGAKQHAQAPQKNDAPVGQATPPAQATPASPPAQEAKTGGTDNPTLSTPPSEEKPVQPAEPEKVAPAKDSPAPAEANAQQVAELRAELARLRDQNAALRAQPPAPGPDLVKEIRDKLLAEIRHQLEEDRRRTAGTREKTAAPPPEAAPAPTAPAASPNERIEFRDDRVEVTSKGTGVPRDRKPTTPVTGVLTRGMKEVKFSDDWVRLQALAPAVSLGFRAVGYGFGICRSCLSGTRGVTSAHWVLNEELVAIPVPGKQPEASKRNGICLGRNERGQVPTHYAHAPQGEVVWSTALVVDAAKASPQGALVLVGPAISAGAIREAADSLRSWNRTLYANSLLVDAPEIIGHGIQWEPYGISWDVSGMARPRHRQLLAFETSPGALTDMTGYATTVPGFVSDLLSQLVQKGGQGVVANAAGGLILSDDAHGQLVYVPTENMSGGPNRITTMGTDMKPVQFDPKVVKLPSAAVVDSASLEQFAKLTSGDVVLEPQGDAATLDQFVRALHEDGTLEDQGEEVLASLPSKEAESVVIDDDPELD